MGSRGGRAASRRATRARSGRLRTGRLRGRRPGRSCWRVRRWSRSDRAAGRGEPASRRSAVPRSGRCVQGHASDHPPDVDLRGGGAGEGDLDLVSEERQHAVADRDDVGGGEAEQAVPLPIGMRSVEQDTEGIPLVRTFCTADRGQHHRRLADVLPVVGAEVQLHVAGQRVAVPGPVVPLVIHHLAAHLHGHGVAGALVGGRLRVQQPGGLLRGLAVAVHLLDERLQDVEVEVAEDSGQAHDLLGVLRRVELVLAVLADERGVETAELDAVEQPAGTVVHVLVDAPLVVAGEHEQLLRGVDAVEQRQHPLLLAAVVDLLELVEDHDRRLLDGLHEAVELVAVPRLVYQDGGHPQGAGLDGEVSSEQGLAAALPARQQHPGGGLPGQEGGQDPVGVPGRVAVQLAADGQVIDELEVELAGHLVVLHAEGRCGEQVVQIHRFVGRDEVGGALLEEVGHRVGVSFGGWFDRLDPADAVEDLLLPGRQEDPDDVSGRAVVVEAEPELTAEVHRRALQGVGFSCLDCEVRHLANVRTLLRLGGGLGVGGAGLVDGQSHCCLGQRDPLRPSALLRRRHLVQTDYVGGQDVGAPLPEAEDADQGCTDVPRFEVGQARVSLLPLGDAGGVQVVDQLLDLQLRQRLAHALSCTRYFERRFSRMVEVRPVSTDSTTQNGGVSPCGLTLLLRLKIRTLPSRRRRGSSYRSPMAGALTLTGLLLGLADRPGGHPGAVLGPVIFAAQDRRGHVIEPSRVPVWGRRLVVRVEPHRDAPGPLGGRRALGVVVDGVVVVGAHQTAAGIGRPCLRPPFSAPGEAKRRMVSRSPRRYAFQRHPRVALAGGLVVLDRVEELADLQLGGDLQQLQHHVRGGSLPGTTDAVAGGDSDGGQQAVLVALHPRHDVVVREGGSAVGESVRHPSCFGRQRDPGRGGEGVRGGEAVHLQHVTGGAAVAGVDHAPDGGRRVPHDDALDRHARFDAGGEAVLPVLQDSLLVEADGVAGHLPGAVLHVACQGVHVALPHGSVLDVGQEVLGGHLRGDRLECEARRGGRHGHGGHLVLFGEGG
ncbi:hypothetical protein Q3G72_022673 [Acer saccharum]|nr:hypothetical protein Q3G72_022673 [Acer saccharum]